MKATATLSLVLAGLIAAASATPGLEGGNVRAAELMGAHAPSQDDYMRTPPGGGPAYKREAPSMDDYEKTPPGGGPAYKRETSDRAIAAWYRARAAEAPGAAPAAAEAKGGKEKTRHHGKAKGHGKKHGKGKAKGHSDAQAPGTNAAAPPTSAQPATDDWQHVPPGGGPAWRRRAFQPDVAADSFMHKTAPHAY